MSIFWYLVYAYVVFLFVRAIYHLVQFPRMIRNYKSGIQGVRLIPGVEVANDNTAPPLLKILDGGKK